MESLEQHRESLRLNDKSYTLLLPVTNVEVPSALEAKATEAGLSKKTEFHVTLIGSATGKVISKILKGLPDEERKSLLIQINDLISQKNWNFTPTGEYHLISKNYSNVEINETRTSHVEVVDLPDLDSFYESLNSILKTNFEVPFPHITLFTTSTNEENKLRGIGVYSHKDFEECDPIKITV